MRTESHSSSAAMRPGLGEQLVDRQARQREIADLLQPGQPRREQPLRLEGLRPPQRLRAQPETISRYCRSDAGKSRGSAKITASEPMGCRRRAVAASRAPRTRRPLQRLELGIAGAELLAVVDEDRLPGHDDVTTQHGIVEPYERERRVGRCELVATNMSRSPGGSSSDTPPACAFIEGTSCAMTTRPTSPRSRPAPGRR